MDIKALAKYIYKCTTSMCEEVRSVAITGTVRVRVHRPARTWTGEQCFPPQKSIPSREEFANRFYFVQWYVVLVEEELFVDTNL